MSKLKKGLLFLMLVLLGFTFVYGSITTVATTLAVNGVDIIYTNPGEDCMSEVIISWHSSDANSKLIYTKATDKNYENATTIEVTGVYDDTSFIYYDVCRFYKCKVELKGLDADTYYIYKVSTGKITSREHKFKTAGTGDFTFGYMSDIHAVPYDNLDLGMTAVKKLQTVQTLLTKAKKVSGELSMIVTTGDEVWRGSQYSNWLEWSKTQYVTATEDFLWAGAVGNHEYYTQVTDSVGNYYPDKYKSDPSAIYSDPDYFYNTYFNAVKSVPNNGPEGIPSCYWFLYNNVLFISIDSMQVSEYAKVNQIREWFCNVVESNEGKYQYIIAYQHYPWYDFETGNDKRAYLWYDLFDRYGVDLALSGHMHGYLRTKQLYNQQISTDENVGTYYVVSPQIGDRPKSIKSYNNVDLFAKWESTIPYKDYSAMSTITVTKEGMVYRLIDVEGNIKDEFTIKAKRAYTIPAKTKNEVTNSITLSSKASTVSVNMDPNNVQFIKNIQLTVDNNIVKSISPSTKKVSYLNIDSLNNNAVHDVRMVITYIDDTTKTVRAKLASSDSPTLIKKLEASASQGKIKLDWQAESGAASYKVLVDDIEVASANSSETSALIDLSKVNNGSKYTLEALNAAGEVICMKDAYYDKYGDCNLDGAVDSKDVNALIDLIFAGTQFNDAQIKLLDNNKDGKVDIGDAYKILSYANGTITKICDYTYTVIIVDEAGNFLTSASVKEGEDLNIEAPVVAGKTFKGYSLSTLNIRSNMILVAKYE